MREQRSVTRKAMIRGVQVVVVITLCTFAWLIYRSVSSKEADLAAGLAHLHPVWLVVAALSGLGEGIFGGLRCWLLGRVLWPGLRARTGIASEYALIFAGGVTPAQAGSAPTQIAVLMHAGMRFAHVAATAVMVGTCTILFYVVAAIGLLIARHSGVLVVEHGEEIDWLVRASAVGFGVALVAIVFAATNPPVVKGAAGVLAFVLSPLWRGGLRLATRLGPLRQRAHRALERRGALVERVHAGIDEVHAGFRVYARRGKRAYLGAILCTWGLFLSRFSVAYFLLLGLGLDTTPSTFVMATPAYVQVIVIQTLLNFALYFSPTPGASGIAEAGTAYLMAPWVPDAFALPFVVLWRLMAFFLSMFVGGLYVFRFLGTDVLEERTKEADAARQALRGGDRRSSRGGGTTTRVP